MIILKLYADETKLVNYNPSKFFDCNQKAILITKAFHNKYIICGENNL